MVLEELDIGDESDQLLASSSPKVSPRKAVNHIQALLLYRGFWGLEKTVLKENRVIGGLF